MEKDIEIKGLNLHFEECGDNDGIPIIMMHGWGCDHTTLASIRKIAEQKLHVYNLDLPGHGRSSEPDRAWGVEDYTAAVEEFMKKMDIENPVVLGHSFGGRIAIILSSRNKIRKNIFVDAAGIKPRRSLKYYFKVYSYKSMKRLLPVFTGKRNAEKIISRYRNKAGSSDYNNASPMMRAVMSRCVNEDLKHFLPSVNAPTLLIWGENDTATPLSDAKTMERLIPDSGLVSFPGCGHYSFLDNPSGFKAVFKEFLKTEMS